MCLTCTRAAVCKADQVENLLDRFSGHAPGEVLLNDRYYQDLILHSPQLETTVMLVATRDLPLASLQRYASPSAWPPPTSNVLSASAPKDQSLQSTSSQRVWRTQELRHPLPGPAGTASANSWSRSRRVSHSATSTRTARSSQPTSSPPRKTFARPRSCPKCSPHRSSR